MSELHYKIQNNISLSKTDFLNKDIRGVDLRGSILPDDYNLFQDIYCKDLTDVKLPIMDMNKYNFSEVNLTGCVFSEGTIFSQDLEFFQKIKFKSLNFTVLPSWDFCEYDFNKCSFLYTEFGKDTKLPNKENFLISLDIIKGVTFPEAFRENCYMYKYSDDIYKEFIKHNIIDFNLRYLIGSFIKRRYFWIKL